MIFRWWLIISLALTACFAQNANQKERDLVEVKNLPTDGLIPGSARPKIPRSYAVVIGISQYKNLSAAQQLPYAERDAESIYSILISPEGGNFRAENVHKLTGSAATLTNLRREIEQWLPSVAKNDDRVLLYFAGHGFVEKNSGEAYFAPYDIKLDDLGGTGYPMATVNAVMGAKIQAKDKILLTDSCHSGAIAPDADIQTLNRSLVGLNRSIFSLTASREQERSFESPDVGGGHGIFTYYVVKGLEGAADESGDGYVTADELAEYVHTTVREATGGKQNPTSDRGRSTYDPSMILAYVPSHIRPGAPPPPKTGTLIFESNMDGVEVILDGKSEGLIAKGKTLQIPGLQPGAHTVQGVRLGYEADGPREEVVYPGQEKTVTLKILIQKRRNKAALDHLDRGLEYYTKGAAQNYKKAREEFLQALAEEPRYSQAALYLGRVDDALFDREEAQKYYRRAIEIDPDYLEARASFGGMLLNTGNLDEAVRQLNAVTQRDPKHAMAWYLLSQAFCRKEDYPQAISAAQKAIELTPGNAEAHFWLAECLRMSRKWSPAREQYDSYLKLSNFDSKLAGQLNYYVVGYLVGLGRRSRASQHDIWQDLRSLAYFGMCDCDRKMSHFDAAEVNCQKALSYDPDDAMTHYALGLTYIADAQENNNIAKAVAARTHFKAMLTLNSQLAEADAVKKMIDGIDAELKRR